MIAPLSYSAGNWSKSGLEPFATKSVTKGDSERATDQADPRDLVALAAVSEAMGSVQDSNVLLSEIFANIFASSGSKSKDEGYHRQPIAR